MVEGLICRMKELLNQTHVKEHFVFTFIVLFVCITKGQSLLDDCGFIFSFFIFIVGVFILMSIFVFILKLCLNTFDRLLDDHIIWPQ